MIASEQPVSEIDRKMTETWHEGVIPVGSSSDALELAGPVPQDSTTGLFVR